MSEPVVTRRTLRRDIGKTARMRFYLRYPDGNLDFSAGADSNTPANDTQVFYCNSLKQNEDFWENAYIYVNSSDSDRDEFERMIVGFNADKSGLYLEWPCTSDQVPTSDDNFELLDMWPAHTVHDKINDAIRDSWRAFPEVTEDETLVIREDKRRYDLTGLTEQPAYLLHIWMERSQSSMTGQVTTVTDSDSWGDTGMDLSALTASTTSATDWAVSIYSGAGAGQLFEASAASTTTQLLDVTSTLTSWTNPDTTSKIRVWNKNEEDRNWYPLYAAQLDRLEFPSYFDVIGDPHAYYGYRFRLRYIREPVALSADTDTTTVPQYFVKNKALAFLHDDLVGDNRANRQDHVAIAEHYDRLARDYQLRNPRRLPSATIWEVEGGIDAGYGIDPNPLDW